MIISESNEDTIVINLYRIFDDKRDYKKLLSLIKGSRKFFKYDTISIGIDHMEEHRISDDVTFRIHAKNYDSTTVNNSLYPVKIQYRINGPEQSMLHISCANKTDIDELIKIVKSGLVDFDNKNEAF